MKNMEIRETEENIFVVKGERIRTIPRKDVYFLSPKTEPPGYVVVPRNFIDCLSCAYVQKPDSYYRTQHSCKLYGYDYGGVGRKCDLFQDEAIESEIRFEVSDDKVLLYKLSEDEEDSDRSRVGRFMKRFRS